jgi:surfeit locus 1 family protein
MTRGIGGFRPNLVRPLVPGLFASVVVLGCLGLGVWQLDRLAWKRALIAERQTASQAAPVAAPRRLAEAGALEFHPVVIEGTLLHDKEIYLGATGAAGGKPGFHVLTPLRESSGRIVFVNRGYVPSELRDPAKRSASQLAGAVRVAGLLRLPKGRPNWLVPDNRPDRNYWFWVDLPAMRAAAGLAAGGLADIAPFYVDADATPNPAGWPKGGVTPIALANDHLQYAITWFSLAAAGIVVYLVWRRQTRRSPAETDDRLPRT